MSQLIPMFQPSWLQAQGIKTCKFTPANIQSYGTQTNNGLITPEGNAGSVNLTKSGTYYVSANNKKTADTIEVSGKNNIFATIDTDCQDQVRLDGPGWKQVNSGENNQNVRAYINNQENNAVLVYGKGTVNGVN